MKNKKSWKVASLLVALCLLTTCVVGTTLAKYTTTNNAADTAHVAKWGVTVSASGTLFGKNYGKNTSTVASDSIIAETHADINVKSTDKVVAPGTKNDVGLKLSVTGTPEVTVKLTAEGTEVSDVFLAAGEYGVMVKAEGVNAATDISGYYTLEAETYTLNGTTAYDGTKTYYQLTDSVTVVAAYYPIQWTVDGNDELSGKNLEEITTALVDKYNNKEFAAGTDLSTKDLTVTLKWAWTYHVDDEKDKADTILGNLIAAENTVVKKQTDATYKKPTVVDDYKLTAKFTFKLTATQVD